MLKLNPGVTPVAALLVLLLAGPVGAAGTVERQGVTNLKPLFVSALANGQAHGVLIGPAAQTMSRLYGSTAPIEVDVERSEQPVPPEAGTGCAILRVTTRQSGVREPLPGSKGKPGAVAPPSAQSMTYRMGFCEGGRVFPAPAEKTPFERQQGASK
jgi:hypothetical protein